MARKTRKKVPNDPAPAFSPPPRPADTAPNPLDLDATALMAAYRTGLYRPSQVVGRCITLIDHANPRLNFLVEDRFEAALAEAQASDERWKRGEPAGELDGVPLPGLPAASGISRCRCPCPRWSRGSTRSGPR
ncbi:MAG: hypothetical protein CVT60_06705 [Actinobacteria bacterium HGW-Actinobacteria-10]|nr:MAG: hypothetical protein CVT60_06705 [Actinobacteria bacterium HGW-Actinobacteria-10]